MPAPDVVARLRAAGCVFAEDEAELLAAIAQTPEELRAMVDRRVAGLPLEQVVGWAEFGGLRIAVAPGVFVPRRRTEFLVQQAVALAGAGAVVVDLCCGAGAIAAALAAALAGPVPGPEVPGATVPAVEVHAADIDPAAVACARRNVPGAVYQGDLFDALPASLRGRVTILTANVPYVPTAEIDLLPPEARLYEPRFALDGGPDGLDLLRRVAAKAPCWLAPGGWLFIEISGRQAAPAVAAFAAAGLAPRTVSSPELAATVILGSRSAD